MRPRRAGLDHRGQPEFQRAVRCLVYVCAQRYYRGAGRTTLVYGAGPIYAGHALDSGDDLRNHGRHVRHTDAARPDDHAGGERNAGIPELLGGDVCLQFQWRKQQRFVWKHRLEPRRTGAPRLHVMRTTSALNTELACAQTVSTSSLAVFSSQALCSRPRCSRTIIAVWGIHQLRAAGSASQGRRDLLHWVGRNRRRRSYRARQDDRYSEQYQL